MFATTMAYLVDEAGVIARDVAVGLERFRRWVLELKKLAHCGASTPPPSS